MAEINAGKVGIEINMKNNTDKPTKEVKKNLESIGDTAEKSKSKLLGLFTGGALYKAGKSIVDLTKKSANYIETLNVLDVAFNDNTKSIRQFTKNISDTLNLDDASILKMVSSFKMLANSMGYTQEIGDKFSKLMTQINLDTASLYNMTLSDTQAMLQSAVQGQTKALRKQTGVSILDRDVQTTLDVLGIDAYVQNMTSAEKSLARVITMTYRLRDSQGDLARTIEAPANQFRVLTEQISLLGRNIGNVFLPAVAAVLPYLNAVLIVLNKLISSLAALLGFKENAWDTFTKKTDSLSEAFEDLGGSVGGVGSAAKETKKQLSGLREFDKLNVIRTPNTTGSSGGAGGGAGGINQNLLDAFNKMYGSYNSMLDGVETKATKIAKKIMKAFEELDFTNLIASGKRLADAFKPFAENVGQGLLWTFNNVLKPLAKWTISDLLPKFLDILANGFKILNNTIETLKPVAEWLWENFLSPLAKWTGGVIINVMKRLNDILTAISKNKIASTITTLATAGLLLYNNFGKVVTILGKSKLLGAIDKLLTPTKKLLENIKIGKIAYGNLKTSIGEAIQEWRIEQGIIDRSTGKFKGFTGVLNGVKTGLTGIAVAGVGLVALDTSFKDIAKDGADLGNVIGALSGSFMTLSGSITAGAAIGGQYGAIVGGVVGTMGILISAFDSFNSGQQPEHVKRIEELRSKYEEFNKTIDDVYSSFKASKEAITENYEAKLLDLESADTYRETLSQLIDTNGKVKQGYEDEAEVIIKQLNEAYGSQLKLEDGVLKNGEDIIKNKEDIIKVTDKTVEAMKKQVLYESYLASYKEAVEAKNKATREYNKVMEESSAELEQLQQDYENNKISSFTYLKRVTELQGEAENATKKYNDVLQDTQGTINSLDDVTKAYATQTSDEFAKTAGNITKTSQTMANENKKTFDDALNNSKTLLETQKTNSKNIIEEMYNKLSDKKKEIEKTSITPKLNLDTSSATNSFNKWKNNLKSSFSITLTATKAKADGGILVNGAWRDIAKYDTGGLPPQGQMFIARERGPELVGNISGHTAVMNNNQIVSSVSAGVYQAVKGAMGNINSGNGVYNIYLDKDHKLGSYTLEQLQGMAKSNGKPITIG